MLPQTQPADHIKSSSSTKYTEHCVADKVAEIPKQVNTVSGVDAAPRKKRQRSHWKSRRRNKAFTTQDNNITDTKAPLPEGPSASALSAQAPSVMAVVKIDEVESSTSTRSRRSLKSLNHSASTLSSQDTCGLAGRSCQPQDPSLSRQDPTDTATLSACERVAPTSQPQVSFLSRQELDDTVTSPPTPPSFHPTFSRQIHHGWPRFIHGEGIVTFSSINLRTKISCTVDPTGVVLSATLPLIRTDSAHVDDQQQALSTSALTALRSNLAATVNGKTEQASTIAQGIIRCSNRTYYCSISCCSLTLPRASHYLYSYVHARSSPGISRSLSSKSITLLLFICSSPLKSGYITFNHIQEHNTTCIHMFLPTQVRVYHVHSHPRASRHLYLNQFESRLLFVVSPSPFCQSLLAAYRLLIIDCARKVSKSEPDMSKHERSAMPGLPQEPKEQDVQRHGGLDTEVNKRQFLAKVHLDALREKYGRSKTGISSISSKCFKNVDETYLTKLVDTADASSTTDQTSLKFHVLPGNTVISAQEHATVDPKMSGQAANMNASGSTTKSVLQDGTAPTKPIESMPAANACKEPNIVVLESREAKTPPKVEPAPELKPMPPVENVTSHNVTFKGQVRPNKETYVPPHLRYLTDTGAVKPVPSTYEKSSGSNAGNSQAQSSVPSQTLLSKTGPPQLLQHKQQISSAKAGKKPFVPPHLRHLTDDGTIEPIHSMHEKSSGRNGQETVSVLYEHTALSNAGNSQAQSSVPSQTLPPKKGFPEPLEHKQEISSVKTDKTPFVPPHLRHLTDGVTIEPVSSTREKASGSNEQGTVSDPRDTIALSNTGNSQVQSFLPSHTLPSKTMPPEILEHKQEMSSVNAGKKPMTTIHEVDPDEVFVPPPAKPRTPKALPPPSFEHLLPPHLRNLPKPRFMRTRAQEDAERAAKYVPLDEETVVKRVITRNEASYKPVVELKAPKTLIQELAPNEESGIAIAAEDNLTSTGSKHSHKDSVDSASLDARQQKRWRLFNQGVEAPDLNRYAEAGKGKLNHELADWDDKYASAPRHWDARSQFDGYSKAHKVHIEAWIADRVHEAMTMPFKVNTEDTEWRSGILPASGTRKQWQVYPPDCMMDIVPLEYGPVVHPPELPANDPYSHVTERHEQCSASSSKKFLKEYKAKKRQRQDLKYMRRIELEEMKAAQAARRALQGPKVNIYVRPAQVADIPQITTLYNHYVKNTVHAPELAETNSAEWQERFIRAEKEQLAFLVAVSKGKEIKTQLEKRRDERRLRGQGFNGPRRRANADANRSTYKEILYGFVYAEDHAGKHTMFQHVAEVQVFVDPKHLRLGIGKSLMDRIMPTLDMAHAIRDYTDFVPDDRMSYGEGGTRKIHKILINVGFHIGDEKEFEWRKEWLEQVHDFDHVGIISCLGNKFGKG